MRCAAPPWHARWPMTSPIVLADEPTGNLDSHSGTLVLDLLYRSCKEIGNTLILATHDYAVVQRADRIVELRDGAIARVAPLAG